MSIPNLPTDNLYKFLAIGGLFACVAMYWITNNAIFEAKKESILLNATYESKKSSYLNAYEAYMLDTLDLVDAFYASQYIEKDKRNEFMELSVKDMTKRSEKGYESIENRFVEQFEDLRLYQAYSLKDVFESTLRMKEYLKEREEGSKTVELDKSNARAELIRATDALHDSERVFRIAQDEYIAAKSNIKASSKGWELAEDLRLYSNVIIPVSFILGVIGFILWWFRFQRYQDRLSALQAKKAAGE